jgi:hypothetical protein
MATCHRDVDKTPQQDRIGDVRFSNAADSAAQSPHLMPECRATSRKMTVENADKSNNSDTAGPAVLRTLFSGEIYGHG